MATDPTKNWLYYCPSGGSCSFNTDYIIRFFMLFVFFPFVAVLYIVQLAMVIASYVFDGYMIYMQVLPFNWAYTLARNND